MGDIIEIIIIFSGIFLIFTVAKKYADDQPIFYIVLVLGIGLLLKLILGG